MSGKAGIALLVAGGTGGHLFPAHALAEVLGQRGWQVHLAMDERGRRYESPLPAGAVHIVPSATIASRAPLALASAAFRLARGLMASLVLLGRVRPHVVIGFGGYPTLPPLIAARLRRIPYVLHEQNAVFGRANKALAGGAAAIATGFPHVAGAGGAIAARLDYTGNPARAAVMEAARRAYQAPGAGERFRLLVFGGSQGARVFSDAVPAAIGALAPDRRARLDIVQQAREEDVERVREAYRALGVAAFVAPFFTDLPQRMADAHLIVARAGAGTVSELAAIGRPSILVPLPHSIDNDQLLNARALAKSGGAGILPQSELTPARLAGEIAAWMDDPQALQAAAGAARSLSRPDAAARLADLVAQIASGAPAAPGDSS